MASDIRDPGGGRSYANRVKLVKFEPLKRNVLEIVLEKKTSQKNLNISGEEVANVCNYVGIKVGEETEGYQAHYSRKFITIAVWAKAGISLEKFVFDSPRDFNNNLDINQVRPAQRTEVTLLVTGVPFNTPLPK